MRHVLALIIVGLYAVVTLALLAYNMCSGDMSSFFEQMNKANFLLGPVGFVIGGYFRPRQEGERE